MKMTREKAYKSMKITLIYISNTPLLSSNQPKLRHPQPHISKKSSENLSITCTRTKAALSNTMLRVFSSSDDNLFHVPAWFWEFLVLHNILAKLEIKLSELNQLS